MIICVFAWCKCNCAGLLGKVSDASFGHLWKGSHV